ncbi:MAG: hypothetical protein LH647_16050, partial [Leptolyngbyaceae cyanobacterium CAN_BIN12]|nr:hypothetical protein [Leptolyngbyaceae cyanobacterium CAN_BIN12]
APLLLAGQPAIAQTQDRTMTCYSAQSATSQTLTDSRCLVRFSYEPGVEGALTAVTFQWADGVTTNADITVHHWGAWRTTMMFGRAIVDGEDADFIDLGSGGVCFIIIKNKNQICARQP